ncbi:MAG: NAD(P)H-dependent flavin oxidoreductase [Rhodomicrobium sp.]
MAFDTKLLEMLGIGYPILLAPMAGPGTPELAIAVSEAGGLGSLPCAMLSPEQIKAQVHIVQQRTSRPFNLNFFCHVQVASDHERQAAWKRRLEPYYRELGLDPEAPVSAANRAPFSDIHCELVEALKPAVASFHFGLPDERLLARVKAAGCKVLSSATTVAEARFLEARGADAIIAQGAEAGGHRGIFLSEDITAQPGTFALVPQIVDAVQVPVIAAGGIGDARGIVAALVLGASAVQLGTAYLFCPEAGVSAPHARALREARDDGTAFTNAFTGRPARAIVNRAVAEVGPMAADAPAFPMAAVAWAPIRAKAEAAGSGQFSPLWSGQAAALCREMPAGELTRKLAEGAMELAKRLAL